MISIQSRRQAVAKSRQRPLANLPMPGELTVAGTHRNSPEYADVRWDKVHAIRTALATGRYDIDARMEHLVEHVPDDIAQLLDA